MAYLHKINRLKGNTGRKKELGQSLVEMAIVAPILMFMFLGLIEVGWAIRGYLILLSTGRETARVAARGEVLDFAEIVEGTDAQNSNLIKSKVRYDEILNHTANLLGANDLGLYLALDNAADPNGTVLMTHYFVDSGLPCYLNPDPSVADSCSDFCVDPDGNGICDCTSPDEREPDNLTDDMVLFPGKYGYQHFVFTAGISNSVTSAMNDLTMINQLKEENDSLNCQALNRSRNTDLSINSMIIVETFYDQKQLVGVPLISNSMTDPVSLYSRTTMRISPSEHSQGEGCELTPIALQNGFSLSAAFNNQPVDWVTWMNGTSEAIDTDRTNFTSDPIQSNSLEYFRAALLNPRLSMNEYKNGTDLVLNDGDLIHKLDSSIDVDVTAVQDIMANLIFQTLTVPVIDAPVANNSTVVGFAKIKLRNFDLANKTISGEFVEWNKACPMQNVQDPYNTTPLPPSTVTCAGTGIRREVWSAIGGNGKVDDLITASANLTTSPDTTAVYSNFDAPAHWDNYYGQRMSGLLCIPEAGTYKFWMASDNEGSLRINTTTILNSPMNPNWTGLRAGAVERATVNGFIGRYIWGSQSTQTTLPMTLQPGYYYIEALMADNAGGDHLAVAWKKNDVSPPTNYNVTDIIPTINLYPAP